MDYSSGNGAFSWLLEAISNLPAQILVWLALYLLLSGLDDLALDSLRLRKGRESEADQPPEETSPPVRMAILIPLWQEAEVAGAMLRHNLAALRYPAYDFFVGVYPNDPATCAVVTECAAADSRIHVCMASRPGPTSKADCLNAVWRGVLEEEARTGRRFGMAVLHDAEDLIHPDSLAIYAGLQSQWGMIQFPVLPLPTPVREFTHGVYCDDFAESQGFDLCTRVRLGAFLPGCGVGTAFRRDALDSLAAGQDPFDESLLTEDYETGLRLYRLGISQHFVPLRFSAGQPVATREYFPRRLTGAIRQRGRWIAGNSLQAWHRHGWSYRAGDRWTKAVVQRWFLWRDRKGLWGNPISLFCNIAVAASLAGLGPGESWWHRFPWLPGVLACNLALLTSRVSFRMWASGRVYGWRFALGVLPRMLWGNLMNAAATGRALHLWLGHRWAGRELAWGKTAHHYPAPAGLSGYKRPLSEVLIAERMLAPSDCQWALEHRREGEDLAASVVRLKLLSEEQMYEAVSLQQGIPLARLEPGFDPGRVARSIPASLQERWSLLPYRVEPGRLYVASAQPPTEEVESEIQRWTNLEVRFHLLPPGRFAELRRSPAGASGYNPENEDSRSRPDRSRGAGAD